MENSIWLKKENIFMLMKEFEKLRREFRAMKDREEKRLGIKLNNGRHERDGNGTFNSSGARHDEEKSHPQERRLIDDVKMKFLQRIDVLEKEKGEVKAEVIKLGEEISRKEEQVLLSKSAMEAMEKKMTEMLQRNKVLEEENDTLKAEMMTVKEEGEKKVLELRQILQKRRTEMLQRIKAVKMTVKEEVEMKILELRRVLRNVDQGQKSAKKRKRQY